MEVEFATDSLLEGKGFELFVPRHEALLLRCGSSIAEEPGTRPGIIVLNVGTFDQPAVAKPGREIFRDDALPWVEVQGEIPRKTAG